MSLPIPPPSVSFLIGVAEPIATHWYDFLRQLGRAVPLATAVYSTSITLNAQLGDGFVITATNGVAFTINAPLNPQNGRVITITIRNASGGALGVITWDAVFKMPAFVNPANANSRSVTFHHNGTNWVQRYQSAADVPN
jgi:hypothetical protein